MRDAILNAIGEQRAQHFGLGYQLMAPPPKGLGQADVDGRGAWLRRCAETAVSDDYATYFDRWKSSFSPDSLKEVTATSRVLVGHGNPSGADVGLTVHHTWGVPMLPGSALKGMLAHYIDATYGQDDAWRGPIIKGRNVELPGEDYRILFGAPPATSQDRGGANEDADVTEPDAHIERLQDVRGRRGWVEFHDALYVPDSVTGNKPFALDVLTVHQPGYYNSKGRDWPSDWDSPNPVGFVTVRPGARFLLAVTVADVSSQPNLPQWRTLALDKLVEALGNWGIGGKTAANYGRLAPR